MVFEFTRRLADQVVDQVEVSLVASGLVGGGSGADHGHQMAHEYDGFEGRG